MAIKRNSRRKSRDSGRADRACADYLDPSRR
jgi:hypothetical protein